MDKTSKVNKITLQIGDKEIELTLEQAKELKEVLLDLFPNQYLTYPYTVYPFIKPIITESPTVPKPYDSWQTWCSAQGSSTDL